MQDIIITGGGLAGLFNAILLNRAGYTVTVIERKSYPFHRVCGEYISNEVLPFLNNLDIDVFELGASKVNRVQISSVNGNSFYRDLDSGGFGISRYTFDHFLYEKAKANGVKFLLNTRAEDIIFGNGLFKVITNSGNFESQLVIGSFGKRSNLDQKLKRDFFYKRSPYTAVKYHIKGNFESDLVQLHNFKNGYCGIQSVENNHFCLCYMVHRSELKKFHTITGLENQSMSENPYLKAIFKHAEFLWDKPEVINEISFQKKHLAENHILMSGDTAGMIAPLCGNGMSMAIHSAKLLSESIIKFYNPSNFTNSARNLLEEEYTRKWNELFSARMFAGRQIQKLFGNNAAANIVVNVLKAFPAAADFLISKTHGKPF